MIGDDPLLSSDGGLSGDGPNLRAPMRVNAETVNDRAKLIMHRLLVRRLRRDPSLLDEARSRLKGDAGPSPDYVQDWIELLALDLPVLLRRLTERSERMARLRTASPFRLPELQEPGLRRRLWRKARQGLGGV